MTFRGHHVVAAAAAVGILASCARNNAFTCETSDDCRSGAKAGFCEATGYCSFPDERCPITGHRYGDHASGYSGECVEPPGDDTSGASGSADEIADDGDPTDADTGTDDPSDPTAPGMTTSDGVGTWWHCDWPRRRELRIVLPDDYATLTDVPVLVVLDDSRIDYDGTATSGADLRFVSGDDTSALHHEIEAWNPAGVSYAWLRIPELTAGEQSVFVYYGNEDGAPLPEADVWASEFRGVWHLHDGAEDASGGIHDGVETNTSPAPGYVGGGRAIRASGQFVVVPDDLGIADAFASGGTVSALVRPESGLGQGRIVGKARGDNGEGGWVLVYDFDRQSFSFVHGFATGRGTWRAPDGLAPPFSWTHVAVTFDAQAVAPEPSMYVDGVTVALDTQGGQHPSGAPSSDAGTPLTFGVPPDIQGTTYIGIVDEVRLESSVRDPVWFAVQRNSFADTLIEYGPEVQSHCD